MRLGRATLFGLLWVLVLGSTSCTRNEINVLVFSKTEGYRHESIEAGIAALRNMAAERGFAVNFTEDASRFNRDSLSAYQAVVFLNTTGDVLDEEQQDAFERYIQAGGGYVGIHSATDTEYDWPWYGRLAGAYFLDHPSDPNVQEGTLVVREKDHWATEGMPDTFEKVDEFYNFRNLSPAVRVVLTIDESTYTGGKHGDYHPMSWYQEFDGGRAFYTAMGHTSETFSEPLFLNHLWAGIHYAAGGDTPRPLDYSKARPEENRFTKVVLAEGLDEPMELTVLDEDRILFIQRNGEVRLYNNRTEELKTIATIPVSTVYVNAEGKESVAEDGLLGLNKDPNFAENHWIYLYYATPEAPKNVLARFEMAGDELLLESKKIILEVPVQREECCHTGGSIAWGKDGMMFLSTGDNTNPFASSGYSPSDERPGRSAWDAQRSSANTNDLRGKILRIIPRPDGTYDIPEGNLFPKGTPLTRPEIYTMGHRNPYRIAVDQRTGYLYWGDVGPDANEPDSTRGPAGHDEVGQARRAGNFGWPHFVGDNKPYVRYDFAEGTSSERWDPAAPVNTSPNNTGLETLPPAHAAFIWYPYGESPEFPLVGTGARNAMAGPVYYVDDFSDAERAFHPYYDGKLFVYDWMRGWIMVVNMDEEGNFASMERFMPSHKFSNPMDMAFAANGDLYLLEYGSAWFSENDDARLVRIEYNGGNRKPQIELIADKQGGALPLSITLSARGSTDADGDKLAYDWLITSGNGFRQTRNTPVIALDIADPGVYEATLTVDDGAGGVSTRSVEFVAGNEAPQIVVEMKPGNRSFFVPGAPIAYDVRVSDREDGTLGAGIAPERVAVRIDYLPEGYDQVEAAQGHRSADAAALAARGLTLMEESDCLSCHRRNETSIGPTFLQIADRYRDEETALELLSNKVINGGSGAWGEVAMAGHPQLTSEQATEMVRYILGLAKESDEAGLPPSGTYSHSIPEDDAGKGVLLFRAAYEDQGADGLPSLRVEETLVLRNTRVNVRRYDAYERVRTVSRNGRDRAIAEEDGSYMMLHDIAPEHLSAVRITAAAPPGGGGKVEVRLGDPAGPLLGSSLFLEPDEATRDNPASFSISMKWPEAVDGQRRDLYLVFVTDRPGDEPLMEVYETRFVLERSTQ